MRAQYKLRLNCKALQTIVLLSSSSLNHFSSLPPLQSLASLRRVLLSVTRSYVLPRSLPSALRDASLRWRVRATPLVELKVPVPPVSQQLPVMLSFGTERERLWVCSIALTPVSLVVTSERESWPSPATATSRLSDEVRAPLSVASNARCAYDDPVVSTAQCSRKYSSGQLIRSLQ